MLEWQIVKELINCGADVVETTEENPYFKNKYRFNYVERMTIYCDIDRCPLRKAHSSWGAGEGVEEASIDAYKKILLELERNCVGNKTPKNWFSEPSTQSELDN